MSGSRIVVGVTGGIAAYKAVGAIRSFVLAGHDVQVIATEAALRFVGAPTFEAISRNPLATDLYDGVAEVRHVALGQRADLIVIAPATANTIAKLANGIADDLLGNTVLASRAPLLIAPAMHTEMWQHPATVANIALLRERGVHVVGPGVGQLTGSDSGAGRMAEAEEIAEAARAILERGRDLAGLRLLVTAGGTREPIDPVRFIGNRSSGRQGVALAEAARDRGADVTLVAAHLEVPAPTGVRLREVGTTRELQETVDELAPVQHAVVMAAAVADYRPAETAEGKLKKDGSGADLQLRLLENPDVLAALGARRPEGVVLVGFAAETESDDARLLELGRAKIARKGADLLVLNRVGWTEGFASPRNTVTIIDRAGDRVGQASGDKLAVAHRILDAIRPLTSI